MLSVFLLKIDIIPVLSRPAKPQDNGVSVDFDVTRHIRLQAGVDSGGGSSVGVGAQWEYK